MLSSQRGAARSELATIGEQVDAAVGASGRSTSALLLPGLSFLSLTLRTLELYAHAQRVSGCFSALGCVLIALPCVHCQGEGY
jgi:hypothetical protein